MKEKKNIDRIYQEKFKDFEREPSDKVWENISTRLDKKDKKDPVIIPLWMKIGSIAAVLALILASLLFVENEGPITGEPEVVFENPDDISDKESKKNPEAIESEENERKSSSEEVTFDDQKTLEGNENGKSNNRSSSAITSSEGLKSNSTKPTNSKPGNAKTSITRKNKTTIASTEADSSKTIRKKEKSAILPEVSHTKTSGIIAQTEGTVIDSTKTKSILEEQNALADIEKEKQKTGEKEENTIEANSKKMRLSTFAAPIFYNNVGSGNELSNQFSENASSSEVTLSYGVKVAYQISKKLSIRTGISKVNISNNIQDISYSPTARAIGFENISPIEDNLNIRGNAPAENGLPIGSDFNNSVSSMIFTPGEINQQFGYIEVPLELEFALINKKFGLNIIGGGSSLFLDNNQVDLISANSKTNLGEATNINSTSFSTNIGLGMDYDITDKFSISVEPIFKYQLNAFKNVENVQPTNFGIYSGLNFRF